MRTRSARTQPCDRAHARIRLDNAQKSLEVAELVAGEREIPASRSVAAALAVLSGIASADVACCAALARRSRGDDHRQAAACCARSSTASRRRRHSSTWSTSRTPPSTD